MLTNVEIKNFLVSQNCILNYDPERLEPASYDMAIGTIFRAGEIINASHHKASDPIEIAPGEVVTMLTLEELVLPKDIAATAYAMNAQSSEGLLVLNPGHVDPGYKGPLTVVALNLRKVPLALQLGDSIFTVVFERLSGDCNPAYPPSSQKRKDVERKTNKKVVEKSIGSLKQLLAISETDINTLIKKHWASYAALAISLATLFAAIAAVVFAVIAVLPKDPTKLDSQEIVQGGIDNQSLLKQATPLAIPTAISQRGATGK